MQEMVIVSEAGLYRLVFRSRKPEAERFKRWLAHDVLPILRKTGRYEIPGRSRPFDEVEIAQNQPLMARVEAVKLAMRMNGKSAARALWRDLGMPPIGSSDIDNVNWREQAQAALDAILDTSYDGWADTLRDFLSQAIAEPKKYAREVETYGLKLQRMHRWDGFLIPNNFVLVTWGQPNRTLTNEEVRLIRMLPGVDGRVRATFNGIQKRATWIPAHYLQRAKQSAA